MSGLNLAASPFVPKRRQTKTNGSVTNSVENKNSQPVVTSHTSLQHNQQNGQTIYKQLLYCEPKDQNGSVLDDTYCIECIPSDFWQKLGDINDTIKSFEKYFNTTIH